MRGVSILSIERQALIRRRYPTTEDIDAILTDLNKMDGPQVTRDQLTHWANYNKITRPKSLFFSPERQEIVRQRWPLGDSNSAILAAINALPGLEVTTKQLQNWAHDHHVKRPDGPQQKPSVFCPERQEITKRMYENGDFTEVILAAVNRIPGVKITAKQLGHWVHRKRLRRPDGFFAKASKAYWAPRKAVPAPKPIRVITVKPRAPVAPPRPQKRREPIPVELRIIYMWGATLGLPYDKRGDPEAVSRAYRKYEDPSHPGFCIRNIRGRVSYASDKR